MISGLRKRLRTGELSGPKRRPVRSAVEYAANNRECMRHDQYLAAGYPIGSGVAEGVVRPPGRGPDGADRDAMDRRGAQAMLHVRALYLNGKWGELLEFRVEQERARRYERDAA